MAVDIITWRGSKAKFKYLKNGDAVLIRNEVNKIIDKI
jgi:hypothetical protein